MQRDVLDEQIAYYRARAQEYDASIGATTRLPANFVDAHSILRQAGAFEQVLELACGTGIWAQTLVQIGRHVTALDAAPEMLALARNKLGNSPVQFQQADLFAWEPVQRYDLVFSGFWLSHVPPQKLDAFLQKVARAV